MTSAVFQRHRQRWAKGKSPMLLLALTWSRCHVSVRRHQDRRRPESLARTDRTARLLKLWRHSSQPEPLQLLTHARSVSHTAHVRAHMHSHTPCARRLWFQPCWKEHPSFAFLPSFLLISPSFSPPHLFSISCGLDFWRQTSPPPLRSSRGQTRFLRSDQRCNTLVLKSVGERESAEEVCKVGKWETKLEEQ